MCEIEIDYLASPEVEQLEARYRSVINGIYAEAAEQMIGASLRSQQHIHRCAVERARPFVEEVGRLRSRLRCAATYPTAFLESETCGT